MMGAILYGVCKTAVFHLDSESVKEKKSKHLFPYST